MSGLVGNPEDRFSRVTAHLIIITSSFYCTYTDYPDSQPVPNKRLRLTSSGDDSLCYNGGQMVEPGIGQSLSK